MFEVLLETVKTNNVPKVLVQVGDPLEGYAHMAEVMHNASDIPGEFVLVDANVNVPPALKSIHVADKSSLGPVPQALFKQLFRFVNVQLFNQLLLRRECCSRTNAEYAKTGLEQVT